MDLAPAWLVDLVREWGPLAGGLLLAFYVQARQNAQHAAAQVEQNKSLLAGLLGGLGEVRKAQADAAKEQAAAVVELRGIRADLSRTEANMTRLAERQGEHGETLATHGARLADHARRIAQLEDHLPTNAPTQLRRPQREPAH